MAQATQLVASTIDLSMPMCSDLCWFVEGKATHNPSVPGSSPGLPHTFFGTS